MRIEELDYELPRELIATAPAEPRDSARLLVCSRSDTSRVEHRRVRELPEILSPGDELVVNTTRVLRARFEAVNLDTGGAGEGLYLSDAEGGAGGPRWLVLIKARRHRAGRRFALLDHAGAPSEVVLTLVERVSDDGVWLVDVSGAGGEPAPAVLERLGRTPLPPYIRGARRDRGEAHEDAHDRGVYQTVYASDDDVPGSLAGGSVAAPTAGLHFTGALLERLASAGVGRAEVTLHVGAGTFKPVEAERVEDHAIHSEWCRLGERAAALLRARASGPAARMIAVGTTSARTLETFAADGEPAARAWRETDLMILPGHAWRGLDGMMTNFHLPRSTLLAMVGALFVGGVPRLIGLYEEAIGEGDRFFSFGDAMLVLP